MFRRSLLAFAAACPFALQIACAPPRAAEPPPVSVAITASPAAAPSVSVGAPAPPTPVPPRVEPDREAPAEPPPHEFGWDMPHVSGESSKYGTFEQTIEGGDVSKGINDHCHVVFHHEGGGTTPLFDVPACIGAVPGVNQLGPVQEVDMPAGGVNGDELHVFQIATARGGNGIHGSDYWVAVIRKDGAWALDHAIAERAELAKVTVSKSIFTLEQPAYTTEEGWRATVAFGSATRKVLPMLPSWVVGKTTRTITTIVEPAYHVTMYHHEIQDGNRSRLVDDVGTCDLLKTSEDPTPVQMKIEVATWSDGREAVKCLSVSR